MKLLHKTNRNYLLFSAIHFAVAGCLLYFMMISIIEEEVTEKLNVNKQRILKKIENGEPIPQLPPVIEVVELNEYHTPTQIVKDTILYDPIEEEPEPFREVTSIETINGKSWRISLRQVTLEPHDYLNSISIALGSVMVLLLLSLVIINRFISRKLWQPFYQSLKALKAFSLQEDKPVTLSNTNIIEFQELNQTIGKLTEKVRLDYHALKEFTENASHEIQTPLAIIQSKLDLLIQSSNMSESQAKEINTAYSATQRLSKLNQTLLLLTKIENNQFPEIENISLAKAIEKQIETFYAFIQKKNLSIEKKLSYDQTVKVNPMLFETLLSNLFSNAIKYNIEGGTIIVELQKNVLTISNTGKPLSIAPEKMFERFTKIGPSDESLGLGLAIVKKLCDINNWEISYVARDQWHILQIKF